MFYKRCGPVHLLFACLETSVRVCFWGKPSIYFLVNIGYYLRPSVVSRRRRRRVPSSSSCPSVRPVVRPAVVRRRRPSSVRPSPYVRRRRPSSVRQSRRPSRRRRPSSARPSNSNDRGGTKER